MAGYQGWFNVPDDGSGRGWNHYRGRHGFVPGSCDFDIWPDVSEYEKTYRTPFLHTDGTAAYLFSPHDRSTVDLHFKWMQQYGIDGVFVQRFITDIKNPKGLAANNRVLENALASSIKYHRAISVMYDLSGMKNADYMDVINDWKHLVDSMHLTARGNRQTWLYHNGKPLVALWGIGFPGRDYHLDRIEKIMDFFKNDPVYGGCSLLVGVPTYWRTAGNDTEKDPHLLDVIRKADIVHPWFVGRFNQASYPGFKKLIDADIAWCRVNKLDYAPVVFPGFSWHNLVEKSVANQIPRNKGEFFWMQLSSAIGAGAQMIYVAMFDEIDEGTAIFKISKNPPVGLSNFVSVEADIPSDYYLYLTGRASKMLRKELPLQFTVPLPPAK